MVYRLPVAAPNPPLATSDARRRNHQWASATAADRLVMGGAGASRPRGDYVFVVNPNGANGSTGRHWKNLIPQLRARLSDYCNIHESFTSGPLQAVELTRKAIKEGAEVVVAVGGDGTLHEVVNGFFEAGKPLFLSKKGPKHYAALGLIPLGTGSDFARTFGWKNDPYEAIERIVKGERAKVDIGVIDGEGEEPHYFINVADVHLSAKAGYYAAKYKRFGNLCYVIGSLRAFIGHENKDFKIKIDGGDWEVFDKVTALCVGNAKFFGGGMKITPGAHPCSGNLEVVILQDFKWYDFVFKMDKLYRGTHLSERNVCLRRVQSIEVEEKVSTGCIYIQSDGEHLGFLPRKISVLPGAIEMIC